MHWSLYLALKQLFPTGRRGSLFFYLSVLGVALGVAVLVVVISVMEGFGEMWREKIDQTSGEVIIRTGGVLPGWERTRDLALADDRVAEAQPFAMGPVMVLAHNRPAYPTALGVYTFTDTPVLPFDRLLLEGSWEDLDDESIFLSPVFARKLGVRVGDTVEVVTPLVLEKIRSDEVFLAQELRVAGIFESGWSQFDTSTVIVSLRRMQDLYALGEGAHGLSLRLREGASAEAVKEALNAELPFPRRALTSLELYEDLLFVIALEKNLMLLLLLFIVVVAVFVIAVAQLLTVTRKTREIGLLGAMGARPAGLLRCYVVQGFLIGVLGAVVGLGLAATFLYFRNDLIHLIAGATGTTEVLVKFYQFANLPLAYRAVDLLVITLSAIVLSTLASLVPAWRAARLRPAEALRGE